MSFKTILAYCNNSHLAERLFDVAVHMAVENKAHLKGLYVIPQPQLHAAIGGDFIGELVENQERYCKSQGKVIKSAFDKAIAGKKIEFDWVELHAPFPFVRRPLLEQARLADLVIAIQAHPESDVIQEHGLMADLVLESGRPVLVVPKDGDLKGIGTKVLVAWNGTRESARAVFDALPLLKKAGAVEIFELEDDTGSSRKSRLTGADLAENLTRHGVNATAASQSLNGYDAGEFLLDRAAKEKFDLLVMGGYGHSRIAEFILGGATRHIFSDMNLPVLMAH